MFAVNRANLPPASLKQLLTAALRVTQARTFVVEPTESTLGVGPHPSCPEPHTAAPHTRACPSPRGLDGKQRVNGGGQAEGAQQPERMPVSGVERKKQHTQTYTGPRSRTKCLLLLQSQTPFYFISLYRILAEDCSMQQLEVHGSDR